MSSAKQVELREAAAWFDRLFASDLEAFGAHTGNNRHVYVALEGLCRLLSLVERAREVCGRSAGGLRAVRRQGRHRAASVPGTSRVVARGAEPNRVTVSVVRAMSSRPAEAGCTCTVVSVPGHSRLLPWDAHCPVHRVPPQFLVPWLTRTPGCEFCGGSRTVQQLRLDGSAEEPRPCGACRR